MTEYEKCDWFIAGKCTAPIVMGIPTCDENDNWSMREGQCILRDGDTCEQNGMIEVEEVA